VPTVDYVQVSGALILSRGAKFSTSGRFENTNTSILNGCVNGIHELDLDRVGSVGVVEISFLFVCHG